MAAAILSQAGLGSLGFNGKLLAPKGSRINPASGLKRIFGPTGWIELGKSLLKVVLLGAIGAWMLWRTARPTMGLASSADVAGAVEQLGGHVHHASCSRWRAGCVADRRRRPADPDHPAARASCA